MLYPVLALGAVISASAQAAVPVGAAARAFSLPAVNADVAKSLTGSADIALFDFTGLGAPHPQAAVVVHFFQPGAGDDVLAQLSQLDQAHSDVTVIGVLSDSRSISEISQWIGGQNLDFPVVYDQHRVAFSRYEIQDSPVTLIIDADGYVYAAGRPSSDHFDQDLTAVLAPLLGS